MSVTGATRPATGGPLEKAIQFPGSPQRDFIGRIRNDPGPLPNKLHGRIETVRKLRGDRDKEEPYPFIKKEKHVF
jgi:hypothetical protein